MSFPSHSLLFLWGPGFPVQCSRCISLELPIPSDTLVLRCIREFPLCPGKGQTWKHSTERAQRLNRAVMRYSCRGHTVWFVTSATLTGSVTSGRFLSVWASSFPAVEESNRDPVQIKEDTVGKAPTLDPRTQRALNKWSLELFCDQLPVCQVTYNLVPCSPFQLNCSRFLTRNPVVTGYSSLPPSLCAEVL